jgi:hypothetical protein
MHIPVSICTSYFMANKKALVNSGATDNFMHPAFAKQMGLGLQELPTPKKIFNIDNTSNKSGMITHYLDLDICTNGIHKEMRFLVTDIGHEEVLLGYPWLATFEPKFNWRSAIIDERVLPIIISSINPLMAQGLLGWVPFIQLEGLLLCSQWGSLRGHEGEGESGFGDPGW